VKCLRRSLWTLISKHSGRRREGEYRGHRWQGRMWGRYGARLAMQSSGNSFAFVGSGGTIEIAVRNGRCSERSWESEPELK